MRIELNGWQKNSLFVVGAVAFCSATLFWVQNNYRAFSATENLSLSGLEKAVHLQPSNAEYHDLLGRYYLFAAQDPKRANTEFQTAVSLDPNSSRFSLDLAT